MKPKKYDMGNPEEVKRWFREMEGYLKIGFLDCGTDREGREYALEGFYKLKESFII